MSLGGGNPPIIDHAKALPRWVAPILVRFDTPSGTDSQTPTVEQVGSEDSETESAVDVEDGTGRIRQCARGDRGDRTTDVLGSPPARNREETAGNLFLV